MTAPWKMALDNMLINSDVEAWTTGMLWGDALAQSHPPSRPTFERWVQEAVQAGKLRKVRAGTFLNAAGHANVSPAVAAGAELDFEQLWRRDYLHGTDGTGAAGSEFELGQNTLWNVSVQGTAMALAGA
jgi:hypothetical protein